MTDPAQEPLAAHRAETDRAINAVWRSEHARVVAGLTRIVRDISLAEELAQEALLAALKSWPQTGVPRNPGAWLMQAGKRKAIDYFRHRKMATGKLEEVGRSLEDDVADTETRLLDQLDDDVGDDVLRLIFTSCHPVLPPESRVALTLRLIGGLTTEEIARAFLANDTTIGQRIVRAKRTIADAGLPFEVPSGTERKDRVASVLGVLYLIFNEGYSATTGADWMRPQLCDEALRMGLILAKLMPEEAEVHGLLALMQLQHSRAAARVNAAGEPVLLPEQDRSRWNADLIADGLRALTRAQTVEGQSGPYTVQAAIAACHARASRAEDTDWGQIAALYALLNQMTPSPVIELNRAVAISMSQGPAAALLLVDALSETPVLANYHLLYGVRGDLLRRLGRHEEANREFGKAAELTRNAREKAFLLARAAEETG
ncbi:RNA polymerase sigma factor [Devosia chinhatensis]|uniref:RNA polymerase subunit sigma-24 n=1 Tax=Devosia chinhatensis TaxID=429727 RepID=A0A0F5FF17_9HYPH|nr:RNA polymerase sigma factor [Devosia chinhatensis]KKB07456.1 RNA polymerase subunit sigma-24 [Devosia chinhatensis]